MLLPVQKSELSVSNTVWQDKLAVTTDLGGKEMKETIYNLLAQQGDMTWQQITMHILVSAVIGLFIFISYVISHKGTIYSKKFGVTLIVLTVRQEQL